VTGKWLLTALAMISVACAATEVASTAAPEPAVAEPTDTPEVLTVTSAPDPFTAAIEGYPRLESSEAGRRAGALRDAVLERGEPFDLDWMPTVRAVAAELDSRESLAEYYAGWLCADGFVVLDRSAWVCAAPTSAGLLIDLEGTLILDGDGNGLLTAADSVFFPNEAQDAFFWLIPNPDQREAHPIAADLADWYYPHLVLGVGEGIGLEPDLEMVGFVDTLKSVGKAVSWTWWTLGVAKIDHILTPASKKKYKWDDYRQSLDDYGLPVVLVDGIAGKVTLDTPSGFEESIGTYYRSGSIALPESFYHPVNERVVKSAKILGAPSTGQVYHEVSHAYWALVVKRKPSANRTFYNAVHEIAWEMRGVTVTLKYVDLGKVQPARLSRSAADAYADEAVAYTVQHYVHYTLACTKDPTLYDSKAKTLTAKGEKKVATELGRGRRAAVFQVGGERVEVTDYGLSDYGINQILTAIGSKPLITSATSKIRMYTTK
jgi:hypothetical protein